MYNLNMKRVFLFLSLLILPLTSCDFSISNNPNGSIFDSNFIVSTTTISYNYTSNDISIGEGLNYHTLSFYNENQTIGKKYTNSNEIIQDMYNSNQIELEITDFKNCYQGINGLLIGEFSNEDGQISFHFSNTYKFVKIIATPVYVKTIDYDSGKTNIDVYDSALSIDETNYIRLDNTIENNDVKKSEIIFKLDSSTLNIFAGLDQTNIMEIQLYY